MSILSEIKNKFHSEKTFQILTYFLKYAIPALAVLFIALYLSISIRRMGYPFDIEWMEGGMVDHVQLIMEGKTFYVEPSINFVPYIYTPLYFYISAGVAEFTGIGYFPLRLVSFISSLACFALIFCFVRKETKSFYWGLAATGFFAATFHLSGDWFDLARVDTLFLAFTLLTIYFIRFNKSTTGLILGGVSAFLTFFTKQSAFLIFIPIVIYLFYDVKWKSLYFILSFGLLSVGASLYMNIITGGYFYATVFGIPGTHVYDYFKFFSFWSVDIFRYFQFLVASIALAFILNKTTKSIPNPLFFAAFLTGMLFYSMLSRIHIGGYSNVLMPAHAALAIMFGISGKKNFDHLKYFASLNKFYDAKLIKAEFLVCLVVVIQLFTLIYDPHGKVPNKNDLATGNEFIDIVRHIDGEVFISEMPYVATYAGKKSNAHLYILNELSGTKSEWGNKLLDNYEYAIKNQKYAAVFTSNSLGIKFLDDYYFLAKVLFDNNDYFKHKTGGVISRPCYMYLPKK